MGKNMFKKSSYLVIGHFEGQEFCCSIVEDNGDDLSDILQENMRKSTGDTFDGVEFYEDSVSKLNDLEVICSKSVSANDVLRFLAVVHGDNETPYGIIVFADSEELALSVVYDHINKLDKEHYLDLILSV